MRILHLIKSFNFGGAENHVRELANALDQHGNTVFVISRGGKQTSMLNKGVKFISMVMSDFATIFQVFYLVYIVKKEKIDLIHAHQRLPVLLGSIAGKLCGIPVVVTIHGQIQYDLRSALSKRLPDRFIFVRQSSFHKFAKYSSAKNKMVLIQNGVEILKISDKRDLNQLFYISRIDRRHSLIISLLIREVIVPLFRKYNDMTFNIVGDGDYLNDLQKEADEINKQLNKDVIILHGYIPDVKRLTKSSGLVMGVGRVAIESLACGVPLLSVNKKHMGGLVTRSNYSFFKVNNFVGIGKKPPEASSLISELSSYFDNIESWQSEAMELQKKIDEDFNIDMITSSICDLYLDAVSEKRAAKKI